MLYSPLAALSWCSLVIFPPSVLARLICACFIPILSTSVWFRHLVDWEPPASIWSPSSPSHVVPAWNSYLSRGSSMTGSSCFYLGWGVHWLHHYPYRVGLYRGNLHLGWYWSRKLQFSVSAWINQGSHDSSIVFLSIRVGLCVVHLVDGWCFLSFYLTSY